MTARIAPRPLAKSGGSPKTLARDRARKTGQRDISPAPFSLRCGALLIDYVLLAGTVALSTILARLIGGGARAAGGPAELVGIFAAIVVAIINFGILTGFTGRSVGKWATGLSIHQTNGSDIGITRSFVRHFIGYPLSLAFFGLGFIMVAFNRKGRALHDLIAGTFVAREGPQTDPRVSHKT